MAVGQSALDIDSDPATAARAIDLAAATGVPAPVIHGDLENFETQHKAMLSSQLVKENAYLQDYINSHPMASKVSANDWANLDEASDSLLKLHNALTLSNRVFPGDPFARFKEGRPVGDLGFSQADLQNHPLRSALLAAVATPPDLAMRALTGIFETGADIAHNIGTAVGGESLGRELGAVAETEAMGLSGRHPIHGPEPIAERPHQLDEGAAVSPTVSAKDADAIKRVMLYADNQRPPPPSMLPEYDKFIADQNTQAVDLLDEAFKAGQKSETKELSPDYYANFVQSHLGTAEIGISGDAIAGLYGDKMPTPDDGLLGWIPGIQDKLDLARLTGADVNIPIKDWLAKADPEVAKALHDDIRVWPGGITTNEAKIAGETKTEAPPVEPIPEPIPAVRAGSALEPLLSIGDRNLKLERLKQEGEPSQFGQAQGFHDFSLNDEQGNPVGTINLSEQKEGKHLYIEMINGINGLGPRDFGPALMKSILRQLKQEFPNAETLGGFRVSGMREKFDTMKEVSINLDRADDHLDDFRRILEGGKWEQYSPAIKAYIKPDPLRSAQDRQLAQIVSDELDRIVSKKVATQVADSISADTSGGFVGQNTGEKIRVGGTYIRYKDTYPIILAALDSGDVLGTARHEAIHHLRQYGFFNHEEWSTLEAQALAGGWLSKYKIDQRYPTANVSLKLEEAVAEAYQDWAKGKDKLAERAAETAQVPSPLDAIFQKMKDFFDRIKARIANILGKDPTWEDIFKRVDTGEVGGREGTAPLDSRSFNSELQVSNKTSVKLTPAERKYFEETIKPQYELSDEVPSIRLEGDTLSWDPEHTGQFLNWVDDSRTLRGPGERLPPSFYKGDSLYKRMQGAPTDFAIEPRLQVEEDPNGGSRVFERANALGMTVDQFKAYDKLIQERHAKDLDFATRRAMEDKAREQTKQWKDDRKALRQEVADNIRQRPDVAADLFFGAGELYGKKVPLGSVKLAADVLTDEQKAGLPRNYYGEHGMHPDDVAGLFGYGSGDAMVERLVAYNAAKLAAGKMSAKDFVSRATDIETDRQMQQKYGALENNILDAVKEHVAGEVQQNLLHEETVALGMKIGQAPLDKAAVLQGLRDNFAKMPLSSVSPDAWMRAAGKAGRQAEFGLLANDPAAAFRAKQQQYYATVIANEAAKLEKDIAKFDKVAKRFSKREVASVDQEYTNFIHDILMRIGKPVRRSIQDLETEIQAGEYHSLQDFVEGKNGFYLREVAVDDRLFDPNFRKAFDDLTVDEFRGVDTSIKSLLKNGRDEKKIAKAGTEEDLDVIRQQMISQLQQFQERQYDTKGGRWMGPIPPRVAKVLRTYGAAHIQMENLFNRWDHDNPRGVFQQYVMRDLVDAANNESAMEKRYATKLRSVDDGADLKKSVDNTLFKVPNSDTLMKLNRGNLRTILLNAGNPSNLSKMARGYGLKPEEVQAWLGRHATAEDWQWAQKIGDIFAELKAEADVMYRNVSGVAPESIPLSPIDTPHGQFPGWYYPLIAHSEFEGPSKRMMGKDALEQEGFVRATTANGYTKARTNIAYPLALDLDMLPARMHQMIHDIAMRPSIINASKIFYDRAIRNAIFKHFGAEWRDMLIPYLVDVANSANYMPKESRMFANASEFLRQNLISTLVGLNPGTVLKHGPTAAVQSLHEVGVVPFLKALKGLTSINERTGETNWKFAISTSEELQRRHQNYVETLGGATGLLQPRSGFASFRSTVQRFSAAPVAASDLLSAVPTWLAQYEKSLGEGLSHGDAVYDADRAVRRAHGSVAITNRSSVMRGGAMAQWFASVYGFFNHIMNRQYELLWKSGEALGEAKAGNYREAMSQAPELTSMLFAYVLAPALIEEMVTPLMSDDKESWGKKAAKGVAYTLGASWVGIRDIANAILNGRDPTIGLMQTSAKTLTDFTRDLGKKAPFSKEHAGKVVKDGATMLGGLTGVVPAQAGRVAEFGLNVSTGHDKPKGPWGWLTGARYGTIQGHPSTFNEWQKHHIGGR